MNIGIIGYGSMGSMLVEKLSRNKDNRLYVYNRTIEKLKSLPPEIYICSSNSDLASKVDVVIMCVRPFDIKLVLSEIAASVRADTLIVSLNGSVSFASMEKIINHKMAKVIPSLTAEIGKSQTLVCFNEKTSEDDKINLESLFKCMGDVILLPENEMGMGSELVSCMPGFIASIFDVLCSAAREHTSIAISRSCVARSTVFSVSRRKFMTLRRALGSSPAVGSSSARTSGFEARTPAKVTSLFSPPESL